MHIERAAVRKKRASAPHFRWDLLGRYHLEIGDMSILLLYIGGSIHSIQIRRLQYEDQL